MVTPGPAHKTRPCSHRCGNWLLFAVPVDLYKLAEVRLHSAGDKGQRSGAGNCILRGTSNPGLQNPFNQGRGRSGDGQVLGTVFLARLRCPENGRGRKKDI